MINKSKLLYSMVMVFFVIVLYYSNRIIVSLDNINYKIVKAEMSDFKSNSKAYIRLPSAIKYNNMLQTISISGTGGCETEFSNNNKQVIILLESEKMTYKVNTNIIFSDDINKELDTKNIKGIENGFSTEFSTLTMKNGLYKVSIFFLENEYDYGLAETDLMIQKENKGLKLLYAQKVENFKKTNLNNDLKVTLWSDLSKENDDLFYTISGLAYIEDKDSETQNVFVEFRNKQGINKTYKTILSDSEWVKDNVGSEYANSNFIVRIGKEDIELDDTEMRIIVEDQDAFVAQDILSYKVNENRNGFVQVFQRATDNFKNVAINQDMNVSLWGDLSKDNNNLYYEISGLAYIIGKNSEKQNVFVEVTDTNSDIKTYKSVLTGSQWLADNIGSKYTNSAFTVKIGKEDIELEDTRIRIIVENEGAFSTQDIFNYKVNENKSGFIQVFQQSIDNFKNVVIDDNMKISIWSDLNKKSNDLYYTISGLAYIVGKDNGTQNVFIEFTDKSDVAKTYKTTLKSNQWLVDKMGSKYNNCEFKMKIGEKDLPLEDIQMRVIIENEGVFTCNGILNYKYDEEKSNFIRITE